MIYWSAPPKISPRHMLDFPQPEENLDKEKTVEGETDCANLAGSRNLDN